MGVWGIGLFDNDVAGDYFFAIEDQLVAKIEAVFADAHDFQYEIAGQGHLLASVAMLAALCETFNQRCRQSRATVLAWRDRYRAAFDAAYWNEQQDAYCSDYAAGRWWFIVDTFARLERCTDAEGGA